MKAELTKMETVGLMGSFNDWAEDLPMTYDWATKIYSAEQTGWRPQTGSGTRYPRRSGQMVRQYW